MMTAAALMTLCAAAQLKPEYMVKPQEQKSDFVATINPDIPSSVTFCGEKVSFDRLDMADRLDRELTSLIYGHTSSLLFDCFGRRHMAIAGRHRAAIWAASGR